MSDPDAQVELPPMKPPRPSTTSTTQIQLEQDEIYARQLAEHYNNAEQTRRYPQSSGDHEPHLPQRRKETGLKPNELYDDREHSFIDDDLPIIKENLRKGFLETQTRVNNWVQNLKKKLDGEESEDEYYQQTQQGQQGQQYGQGFPETQSYRPRRSGEARRSADRERYDADPQVLSDDFATLELRDNEGKTGRQPTFEVSKLTSEVATLPNRPPRPTANPDLFKPKSPSPDRRKVSFQEGPPEEITGPYSSRQGTQSRSAQSLGKASKWQPLAAVEPSPVADHDPFSLGDTDDEKEVKKSDAKPDDAEKATKATTEATESDIGPSGTDKKSDKAPESS
ncbi:predicted protein [Uncinocarpus reesii 1704]|uniref:CUE domain-containing protein n=1 Tax=Uncinocarpus reesii (strain UAMH 1704) TaxID=336963 RepID=C4JTH1_UNCRE|nr:uncharacterized protein UREG_05760 [Uncinocarpus reesii 1704]EEP80918.1 predicted protein [Uncinocarpus reesii 1704]